MNFVKDEFLKTTFCRNMIVCVTAWDYYLNEQEKNNHGELEQLERIRVELALCMAKWEVYQAALMCFYNVEYYLSRTEEYFGICTEDESDWLFKEAR